MNKKKTAGGIDIIPNAGYVKLHYFDRLSEDAKEKAREWYRDSDDSYMLESHLENLTKEKLEERGYKADDDHVKVYYDLGYSQSSHFYFTGNIIKDGINYGISQHDAGYTPSITCEDSEGNDIDAPRYVYGDFTDICKEMLRAGYDEIEYQSSNEVVDDCITVNEYTFTSRGVRMDSDHD